MSEAVDIFYSYAHKDKKLRERLDTHLALLKHEGLINQWHDRDISAGKLWAEEIDAHLKNARIILLLVSSDFNASDYCYGIEMQEAIKRQVAGEARVIPIILRPCDWETAPFGKLQALPKDKKPVTTWSNRDLAFTEIAKGIRTVVHELNGDIPMTTSRATQKRNKNTKTRKTFGGRNMSGTLSSSALKKPIDRYYNNLDEYKGKADYELAVRTAFQNLLAETARLVGWTFIPEQAMESGIRPDGVLRDEFVRRGF
jgi:TIR domain-containing protein